MRRLLIHFANAVFLAGLIMFNEAPSALAIDRYTVFMTPTKNIVCEYSPMTRRQSAFIECGFSQVDYYSLRSLQARSCPIDPFGRDVEAYHFTIDTESKPYITCDTSLHYNPEVRRMILPYGKSFYFKNDFVCTSRQSGLTCTSNNGNGFFLSRAKQKIW